VEIAGTGWIPAGTTAEAFRAPEDAAGRDRMTAGDRMITGVPAAAMTGPAVEDEVPVADRFRAVFLSDRKNARPGGTGAGSVGARRRPTPAAVVQFQARRFREFLNFCWIVPNRAAIRTLMPSAAAECNRLHISRSLRRTRGSKHPCPGM